MNSMQDQTSRMQRCVKCLGAYLDKNLNFKEHVKNKAKVAMTNLMKIRNIRNFLTKEACEPWLLVW